MHDPWIRFTNPGTLPSGAKAQACIWAEALNYVVINNFLFRIDTRKDKDQDKENSFLLVIPEIYRFKMCFGIISELFYFTANTKTHGNNSETDFKLKCFPWIFLFRF